MEELKENQVVEERHVESEDVNQVPEKEEAGWLGIIASALFPLIGIIIYFVQRKEVKNPSAYLWGALAGFVIGLILRAISAS